MTLVLTFFVCTSVQVDRISSTGNYSGLVVMYELIDFSHLGYVILS